MLYISVINSEITFSPIEFFIGLSEYLWFSFHTVRKSVTKRIFQSFYINFFVILRSDARGRSVRCSGQTDARLQNA